MEFVYGSSKKEPIFQLPCAKVMSVEFEQKVGRRAGSTIALGDPNLSIGALTTGLRVETCREAESPCR